MPAFSASALKHLPHVVAENPAEDEFLAADLDEMPEQLQQIDEQVKEEES